MLAISDALRALPQTRTSEALPLIVGLAELSVVYLIIASALDAEGVIRLDGQDSFALIHYPADMKFYPEKLVVRQKDIYHRLNFEKPAPDGTIEIKAELFRKVSDPKPQSEK